MVSVNPTPLVAPMKLIRQRTNFEHIFNALEYILLDPVAGLPPVDVISLPRWAALSSEYASDVGFSKTSSKEVTDAKLGQFRDSMILISQGFGHIRDHFDTGHSVLAQFRYWDMRVQAEFSANYYSIAWDVCLDILVRGDRTAVYEQGRSDHSGIYNPDRGRFVDQVIHRFAAYPVLHCVMRDPKRPFDDDDTDTQRYWLGGEVDAGDNMLTADWPSGWVEGQDPADSPFPAITGFSMNDGTDLNYWTLLWAHGAPDSYQGYFPTTIKFTIVEKRPVGVASTGSGFA